MNKKKFIKHLCKFIPFFLGIILFIFKYYTLFSSILLFCGGYIAVKNTLDYRQVKKNIIDIKYVKENTNNNYTVPIRRIKRNIKVRKRVK